MTPTLTMGRIYAPLTPRAWYLGERKEDEPRKTLLFHLEHGDYFGTLATILSLLADQLESAVKGDTAPTRYQIKMLGEMRKDLVYLQEHWVIRRKDHTP